MKKLITFSTLCLIASIIFSSCGTNFSITRRHYNPGYYIDYTKSSPSVASSKVAAKPVQSAVNKQLNTEQPKGTQTTKVADVNPVNRPIANSPSGIIKKIKHKAILSFTAKQGLKNTISSSEEPQIQAKSYVPDAITMTDNATERGGGRSLLLLLLIILVIILLIGILLNLGAFIDLLFDILIVILLILLILWLLKVLG
ncbi:MAG: hypothetical protein ACLQQ4_04200 [Bacteroidia bacterium]